MNNIKFDSLISSATAVANETSALLNDNKMKENFHRRLSAVWNGYLGVVDIIRKNLQFFVKNGAVKTRVYDNKILYHFGQNPASSSVYSDDHDLEVTVENNNICRVSVASPVCKNNLRDFPEIESKYIECGCEYVRKGLNFDHLTSPTDSINELRAKLDNPEWYTDFKAVERFDKALTIAEKYYLGFLPLMVEICINHIKTEIELKNKLVKSISGVPHKVVRRITIDITEETVSI